MKIQQIYENVYIKTPDFLEKEIIKAINKYFMDNKTLNTGSVEYVIREVLSRFVASLAGQALVTSVNGKSGAVTLNATDVQAEPIISIKNTAFNKDFGTISGTVCQGNDYRLTDNRYPTAHTHEATDIDNLNAAISINQNIIDLTANSHTHTNKSLLDKLVYTGTLPSIIDLKKLENLPLEQIDNSDIIIHMENNAIHITETERDILNTIYTNTEIDGMVVDLQNYIQLKITELINSATANADTLGELEVLINSKDGVLTAHANNADVHLSAEERETINNLYRNDEVDDLLDDHLVEAKTYTDEQIFILTDGSSDSMNTFVEVETAVSYIRSVAGDKITAVIAGNSTLVFDDMPIDSGVDNVMYNIILINTVDATDKLKFNYDFLYCDSSNIINTGMYAVCSKNSSTENGIVLAIAINTGNIEVRITNNTANTYNLKAIRRVV
jgi:hypothetical protein